MQRIPKKKTRRSVALLIETSNAYARGLLEGIAEYQRERDNWSIFLPEQERGAAPPTWLRRWQGDGIIARIETSQIARFVTQLNLPVVDLSAKRVIKNVPWVETDDAAIAKLAFEHLYERGFRNFAFCGPKGFNWSKWRFEQFQALCQTAKVEFHAFHSEPPRGTKPKSQTHPLEDWLHKLPKPIGMLCAYDIQAQIVLDTCRNREIAVPEQIAVIGVDNDAILCDLCHPSLTSIAPDARGAGYAAAKLLDQLMDNRNHPIKQHRHSQQFKDAYHLLKPIGIVQRQSTDVTAIADSRMTEALRYIRDHACDGINVLDVLSHISMSRRSLEFQFARVTGKTPHEMILSVRMSRARQLLMQTDMSLDEIADRCGFEHPEYLSVVFKRHFGTSPGRFRKTNSTRSLP